MHRQDEPVPLPQEHLWDVEKDRTQAVGEVLTSGQNLPVVMQALRTAMNNAYHRATGDGGFAPDKEFLELMRLRDNLAAIAPEVGADLTGSHPDYRSGFAVGDELLPGTAADLLAERDSRD